jgi:hypothetical protein
MRVRHYNDDYATCNVAKMKSCIHIIAVDSMMIRCQQIAMRFLSITAVLDGQRGQGAWCRL